MTPDTVEQELRAVMLAHDAEAPDARRFVPYVDRKPYAVVIAAAVVPLCVVAIVFVMIWVAAHQREVAGSDVGTTPTLVCPPQFRPHASPATPRDALVPDETPTAALVCSFRNGRLVGSRPLQGPLRELSVDLHQAPSGPRRVRTCSDIGHPGVDEFVLVLRFRRGTVTVFVSDRVCEAATNGRFGTDEYLINKARLAYRHGSWIG